MEGEGQGNNQGTGTGSDQGGTGTGAAGWIAALPDDQKNDEYVKTFTKPGDFVAAALKTRTEMGALNTEHETLKARMANAVVKPGENATAEELEAYAKAVKGFLGVPESPDKYEFPEVNGIKNSPEMVTWARDAFFKAELSPEQVKTLLPEWNQLMVTMQAAQDEKVKKEQTAAVDALKASWGDKYDGNAEAVKKVWGVLQGEKLGQLDAMVRTEVDFGGQKIMIGNIPGMMELALWIGKKVLGDSVLSGNPPGGAKKAKGFDYGVIAEGGGTAT